MIVWFSVVIITLLANVISAFSTSIQYLIIFDNYTILIFFIIVTTSEILTNTDPFIVFTWIVMTLDLEKCHLFKWESCNLSLNNFLWNLT